MADNPYQSPISPGGDAAADLDSGDLSTVDWVIAVVCSGIGCIIGIIRLIQGKANGGKMLGVSLLFMVLWGILRAVLQAAAEKS